MRSSFDAIPAWRSRGLRPPFPLTVAVLALVAAAGVFAVCSPSDPSSRVLDGRLEQFERRPQGTGWDGELRVRQLRDRDDGLCRFSVRDPVIADVLASWPPLLSVRVRVRERESVFGEERVVYAVEPAN